MQLPHANVGAVEAARDAVATACPPYLGLRRAGDVHSLEEPAGSAQLRAPDPFDVPRKIPSILSVLPLEKAEVTQLPALKTAKKPT